MHTQESRNTHNNHLNLHLRTAAIFLFFCSFLIFYSFLFLHRVNAVVVISRSDDDPCKDNDNTHADDGEVDTRPAWLIEASRARSPGGGKPSLPGSGYKRPRTYVGTSKRRSFSSPETPYQDPRGEGLARVRRGSGSAGRLSTSGPGGGLEDDDDMQETEQEEHEAAVTEVEDGNDACGSADTARKGLPALLSRQHDCFSPRLRSVFSSWYHCYKYWIYMDEVLDLR